jgi:hypothetical protein
VAGDGERQSLAGDGCDPLDHSPGLPAGGRDELPLHHLIAALPQADLPRELIGVGHRPLDNHHITGADAGTGIDPAGKHPFSRTEGRAHAETDDLHPHPAPPQPEHRHREDDANTQRGQHPRRHDASGSATW